MAAAIGAAAAGPAGLVPRSPPTKSSFIALAECLVVAVSPDCLGAWDGGDSAVQYL